MQLFLELIQVSLGNRDVLTKTPNDNEWEYLFGMSVKQAVAGVAFQALDGLAMHGQKLPTNLFFQWLELNEQIKRQNLLLNLRSRELTQFFTAAGYKTCILKGQGNARMYPNPLSRTPGDIDLWVYGKIDGVNTPIVELKKEILSFVRERTPEAFEQSYHIDFPIFDDAVAEVHYLPSILFNSNQDKKFRKWCQSLAPSTFVFCEDEGFNVPSVQFNAVYQMVHLYSHFFTEGVGMRHFIDYYYVLKNMSPSDLISTKDSLNKLGMKKFASGVMWIERHVLGIADRYLIFEPSETVGRLIMKEMEEGGNFGQYDQRYILRNKGLIARGMADTWRLITLAHVFPTECFWKITEKITNQKYKLKHWILVRWRKN